MQVTAAKIDWMDKWANSPHLDITVDEGVSREHFIYRAQGKYLIGQHPDAPWLYRVTYDAGAPVQFGNGQDKGDFNMEDGTVRTVLNGWVSNAGDFRKNLDLDLFDVDIYVEGERTGWAGLWITMTKLLEIITTYEFDRPVHLNFDDHTRSWRIVQQEALVAVP